MKDSIKKRREKVLELLIKNISESEIAKELGVSRQTVVRDVAFFKRSSQGWISELASHGFIFECKIVLDQLKENAAVLYKTLPDAKNVGEKIEIIKAIGEILKLRLELLSETPTIYSLRKVAERNNVQKTQA